MPWTSVVEVSCAPHCQLAVQDMGQANHLHHHMVILNLKESIFKNLIYLKTV